MRPKSRRSQELFGELGGFATGGKLRDELARNGIGEFGIGFVEEFVEKFEKGAGVPRGLGWVALQSVDEKLGAFAGVLGRHAGGLAKGFGPAGEFVEAAFEQARHSLAEVGGIQARF